MSCATKELMAGALRELMRKKPMNRVTVGDVCDLCEMNRKSFYYHFHDKYELLNWMLDQDLAAAAAASPDQDRLLTLCECLSREPAFYRNAMQPLEQNALRRHMQARVLDMLNERMADGVYDMADRDMLAHALCSVITRWVMDGCVQPADLFVQRLYGMGKLINRISA